MIRQAFGSYLAIFFIVLAEQLGLPIPAAPILVGAGALAGSGQLSLLQVIGIVFPAALAADLVWYEIGRRRGTRVLRFLCRISLEPDSCVRRTQDVFVRRGAWSLAIAKFVPGLGTVAPPLAGAIRMRLGKFLLLDGIGILAWSIAFTGLGFLFSEQLERLVGYSDRARVLIPILLAGGLTAYVGWKYLQRRRFFGALRAARITPDDLKAKLDAGEPVVIVDLRHHLDLEQGVEVIPGALRIGVGAEGELDLRPDEIPGDREVVLYCS